MVNGASIKVSYRVRPLDIITVDIPPPTPIEIRPEAIPLDIVYEDEALVVLNKAAGISSIPHQEIGRGHWSTHCWATLEACHQSGGVNVPASSIGWIKERLA